MKIRQEDNLILTNGKNEKKFTIQASAKAFQILSSALYSRKIEAIVRELSCNAHDSHISAGYGELPFDVHLPNQWEPEFYVEDYGIGLDAEDIENIYTSYFTSTKTDSNDLTGGFGLGSKTPFSYTDSFNIRTRKDGNEYHFNAYINMGGEPSVSLLSMSETTERNGVRVSVPVRSTDFDQFASDAVTVYNWFPTLPNIVGRDVELDNSKALRLVKEGFFWSEYQKDGWERNTISAVMGNVVYHVPNVNGTFHARLSKSESQFFSNNSLYIKFNIGDLDVNAGRESLSFDEDTENTFIQRIKEVIAQYSAETQLELDTNIDNIPDALALVESSAGLWARPLFNYKGTDIPTLSGQNWVKTLRECFVLENYYFARNNRGSVKRHSLDYVGYMTFAQLGKKRVIVMQGDDKGYQRIARELANVNTAEQYGVFFSEKLLTQEEQDAVYEQFGDIVEFVVAADLLAIDKAARKAERDALKASGGATVRAPSKPRIGNDSVRAVIFELVLDDEGHSSYNERPNVITTAADLIDKNYMLVESRYGVARFKAIHPVTKVEYEVSITTTSSSDMYNICRFFGIDMLVLIKSESYAKAVKLFGDGAKSDIGEVDVELLTRVRLQDHMSLYNDVSSAKNLVYRSTSLYYGIMCDLVTDALNKYVVDNPDTTVSKMVTTAEEYSTVLSYNYLPYAFKDIVDEVAVRAEANSIKELIQGMHQSVNAEYPMLSRTSDAEDSEVVQYLADMAELKEFRRLQQIAVQEV